LPALVLVCLLAGCKDNPEPQKREVVPISAAEEMRGIDACTSYVEHLCRCAETNAELKEQCDLIRTARVEALRKALAASRDANEDEHVRWRTGVTARRLISNCIEADNELMAGPCSTLSTNRNQSASEAKRKDP
jgi:hypothetical protein